MGRTLHFDLIKNPKVNITELDWEKICKITEAYNKDYTWTCESLGFSNVSLYPRWVGWFADSAIPKKKAVGKVARRDGTGFEADCDEWKFVNKEYTANEKRGLTYFQNVRNLLERKFIALHGDSPNEIDLQSSHGFTKVAGNEFNALLVVAWLVEVSKVLPKNMITVHDEGEFLHGSIVIKNGKARLDKKDINGDIKYWKKQLNKAEGTGRDYWIEHIMRKESLLSAFPGQKTYPVKTFCRPVNPKDFDKHPEFKTCCLDIDSGATNGGGSQVMAGFSGEYYGKASEAEAALDTKNMTERVLRFVNALYNK